MLSRRASSEIVPGVTTRVTSRRTSPLACAGSSTWSQTATLQPEPDELADVPRHRVVRDAAHRGLVRGALLARGQRQIEQRRDLQRVFEEELVEVAHAIEQDRVRILGLELQVVPEHRRHLDPWAHGRLSIAATGRARLALRCPSGSPSTPALRSPARRSPATVPCSPRAPARAAPGRRSSTRSTPVSGSAAIATPELDGIVVLSGPGSFTGIRVALATALGFRAALAVPVVALSNLAALAIAPLPASSAARPPRRPASASWRSSTRCATSGSCRSSSAAQRPRGDRPNPARQAGRGDRSAPGGRCSPPTRPSRCQPDLAEPVTASTAPARSPPRSQWPPPPARLDDLVSAELEPLYLRAFTPRNPGSMSDRSGSAVAPGEPRDAGSGPAPDPRRFDRRPRRCWPPSRPAPSTSPGRPTRSRGFWEAPGALGWLAESTAGRRGRLRPLPGGRGRSRAPADRRPPRPGVAGRSAGASWPLPSPSWTGPASDCHLEVRADNLAAQALYQRLGFELAGLRRRYYRDDCDAWLYRPRARQPRR